jgi:hypothetical protein
VTETSDAAILRRGLITLSALGVVGTLVELAILRHWESVSELIPWVMLAGSGAALLAVVVKATPGRVRLAGAMGLALAVGGAYGLVAHIGANMATAPLDAVIGPTWESLGIWRQIWMAATGGVGPAPPLSAASLVPTGLALALATFRHPALKARKEPQPAPMA